MNIAALVVSLIALALSLVNRAVTEGLAECQRDSFLQARRQLAQCLLLSPLPIVTCGMFWDLVARIVERGDQLEHDWRATVWGLALLALGAIASRSVWLCGKMAKALRDG